MKDVLLIRFLSLILGILGILGIFRNLGTAIAFAHVLQKGFWRPASFINYPLHYFISDDLDSVIYFEVAVLKIQKEPWQLFRYQMSDV